MTAPALAAPAAGPVLASRWVMAYRAFMFWLVN